MWFSNVLIYHYELDKQTHLEDLLAEEALKPCPPHARLIHGWLPTTDVGFAQEVAGATLICMGKEERILPRSVINRELEERVEAQETQLQRQLKRSEKSQMAEEIEFELLPKAFCLQKKLYALLDSVNQHLIINTSSVTQAEQLTVLLRKSVPGIKIEALPYAENLATRLTEWLSQPDTIPNNLQLASDCILFSPEDEKKRFNCKGCELPADEVISLLNQGLLAAEISVQWNERVQLTITHEGTFKRIKCLDYLIDEFTNLSELDDEAQERDAALVLLSGELRTLINDMMKHIGQTSPDALVAKQPVSAVARMPQ